MSTPSQPLPSPAGEFQAHFGSPPGSTDLAAECKKWEKLCADLIAERQQLRGELAATRIERDKYLKSLYHVLCKDYECPYTMEELLANAEYEPDMEDFIADLARRED